MLLSPVLGAVAGLVAAVAMTVPMSKQSEGFTPAYVAAAALRGSRPDDVRFRDAVLAHHVAGLLVGAAYGFLFALLGALLPRLVAVADGVALLPHVASVALVVAFVYVFFAYLVLPRTGGVVYEEQATAVRGQWLRSTLVFGAALSVVGPLLVTVGG
ncbi:hypothetical protein ACFO0N_05450 [Halobium salinum]|uniref:Uncharacterized protein n=1 Tax=Halobium salinum TaxID=1364940 RepID=A0ABD5PAC2_9EURY